MANQFAASFLRGLLIVLLFSNASYGQSRNEVLRNPKPDLTWSKQVGGLFSTGKSYAVVVVISDYIGTRNGGFRALNTKEDATKMSNFLLNEMGYDYVH